MTIHVFGETGTPADRRKRVAAWAAEKMRLDTVSLTPVSGDASFRRYFRFHHEGQSFIVMDAPPDKEDSAPFVDIAQRLRDAGLNAPVILHFDLEQGFGLLEDFGDVLYRDILDRHSADNLFPGLFQVLRKMAFEAKTDGLPDYHALKLQQEMSLFPDWYMRVHRQRPFRPGEWLMWNQLCIQLIRSAKEQPQVFVHRDFHSCNLLRTAEGLTGIIDFQDGVCGPLSYDFVSLLWDRYIAWPREKLEAWMANFYRLLELDCGMEAWIRWCDLMGLQRNLKIVGIFARLHYRDGKEGYLEMIPRFYEYLLDVLPRYPEFHEFQDFLEHSECAP